MHSARKILCAAIAICAAAFCACQKTLPKKTLSIETAAGDIVTVIAEMATTDGQRQHGFMERTSIPDGTGMLFVWDYDREMHFWMKDTPTALSIAYITSDGTIRDIFDMAPYSLADIAGSGFARYALEVPQGWFSRKGIHVGDRLLLDF